jgi:IstB-like ATP binding protein
MFLLVSSRYERASLIVTSNKPFSGWGEIFGDEVVAAAMIDRLVHVGRRGIRMRRVWSSALHGPPRPGRSISFLSHSTAPRRRSSCAESATGLCAVHRWDEGAAPHQHERPTPRPKLIDVPAETRPTSPPPRPPRPRARPRASSHRGWVDREDAEPLKLAACKGARRASRETRRVVASGQA